MSRNKQRAPVSDSIITAVARLVDDAQVDTREPSHSDIQFQIDRSGLAGGDPKQQGQVVGKAKRVRSVLSWSMEHKPDQAEEFVASLIAQIRGFGGFRERSPNYVGAEAIENARSAFATEGYQLLLSGELQPFVLDNLSGTELTKALQSYVLRAKRGSEDAALLAGTGKDLLEATAAHVLTELAGSYPTRDNFPTLLGQAFVATRLATPQERRQPKEHPQKDIDRCLYEVGCAVNRLRNKEGTGHGRPWVTSVNPSQARTAIELMGVIAERLLERIPVVKATRAST